MCRSSDRAAARSLVLFWCLRALFRLYGAGRGVQPRATRRLIQLMGIWLIADAAAPLLCHLALSATGYEIDKVWAHMAAVQEAGAGRRGLRDRAGHAGRPRDRAGPRGVRLMAIVVRLDVMMARRKVRSNVLARAIGITEANLSLLKSGKVKGLRFSTLEAICRVLDCQPGDLLEFVPDEHAGTPRRCVKPADPTHPDARRRTTDDRANDGACLRAELWPAAQPGPRWSMSTAARSTTRPAARVRRPSS